MPRTSFHDTVGAGLSPVAAGSELGAPGSSRRGRRTSSPPQLGQVYVRCAAQLSQKLHSWLQMKLSPSGESAA